MGVPTPIYRVTCPNILIFRFLKLFEHIQKNQNKKNIEKSFNIIKKHQLITQNHRKHIKYASNIKKWKIEISKKYKNQKMMIFGYFTL